MRAIVAIVLVCLVGSAFGQSDLLDQLHESYDAWVALDEHTYCMTTEHPAPCDMDAFTVYTVTNDNVDLLERKIDVCTEDCSMCESEHATAVPTKSFDTYSMLEWYDFCEEEVLTLNTDSYFIYFRTFSNEDDLHSPELDGVLQMCGYQSKEGGADSVFVGLTLSDITFNVGEEGCVIDEHENEDGWAAALEHSRNLWDQADVSDYCFDTMKQYYPCNSKTAHVTVKQNQVDSINELFFTCDALCESCESEEIAPSNDELHFTIDEWYDWCASEVLTKTTDEYELYLEFFEFSGFLRTCEYVDRLCEDECVLGVRFTDITLDAAICFPDHPVVTTPSKDDKSQSSSSSDPETIDVSVSESPSSDSWIWVVVGIVAAIAVMVVVVVAIIIKRRRSRSKHPYEGFETYRASDWL